MIFLQLKKKISRLIFPITAFFGFSEATFFYALFNTLFLFEKKTFLKTNVPFEMGFLLIYNIYLPDFVLYGKSIWKHILYLGLGISVSAQRAQTTSVVHCHIFHARLDNTIVAKTFKIPTKNTSSGLFSTTNAIPVIFHIN